MKPIKSGILLGTLLIGLASCSEENPWNYGEGQGGINLRLTSSAAVANAIPVTRSQETLTAPEPGEFSIELKKIDGSYSKTWNKLQDFEAESGFPAGAYSIKAFYGNPQAQGFDLPYYEGVMNTLTVIDGKNTNVEIEASLANSMVSIDYTDAFKSYFASWSATVQSSENDPVNFVQNELRPAYVSPGDVAIYVDFKTQDGKEARVQPVSFAALARHHYHITMDVNNGNVGTAQLQIIFDDTVTEENVTIDLSDELFTSPAPKVKASGFTAGTPVEALVGVNVEGAYKFDVVAADKLKEVKLSVKSASRAFPFNEGVDLISATPDQQQMLANAGFKAYGFFKNPDRLAMLDVTEFINTLPEGTHSIVVEAKDVLSRVSEPLTLVVEKNPVSFRVVPQEAAAGSEHVVVAVEYNSGDPVEALSFTAKNAYGVYEKCEVVSSRKAMRTRGFDVETVNVTISLPKPLRTDSSCPAKAFLNGKEMTDFEIVFGAL